MASNNNVSFVTGVKDQKAVPHILSPATIHGGLIYCSGQTPIDASGKVVEGGIKELTTQCVRNLEQVLHHAGSDLGKVIKVQVFLKDMADFAEMNEVYETLFGNPKPARSCIQAGKLPNDVRVEIELIAAV